MTVNAVFKGTKFYNPADGPVKYWPSIHGLSWAVQAQAESLACWSVAKLRFEIASKWIKRQRCVSFRISRRLFQTADPDTQNTRQPTKMVVWGKKKLTGHSVNEPYAALIHTSYDGDLQHFLLSLMTFNLVLRHL